MEDVLAKAFEFTVAGLIGVGGWIARRTINRVDVLEKEQAKKVSREEFNDTVKSMRQEMRDGHEKIYHRIDDLFVVLLSKEDERTKRK